MQVIGGKTVLTSLDEVVDPAHTALIVVDIQNDFCSPDGAWPQQGYDVSLVSHVVPNSHELIDAARTANVRVIYIQMSTLPDLASMSASYLKFMVAKNGVAPDRLGCDVGSWGAEIHPDIAPRPEDLVIKKWRSSAFVGTHLELVLRSNNVQSVVICGVATNACVESTVRDAFNNDFYVVLVEDCVGAYDQKLHEASLTVMRSRVDVVPRAEVIGIWSRYTPTIAASGATQANGAALAR